MYAKVKEARRLYEKLGEHRLGILNQCLTFDSRSTLSNKILDTAVATGLSNEEATKLFGTFMQIGNLTSKQAEDLIETKGSLGKMPYPTFLGEDLKYSIPTFLWRSTQYMRFR